MGPADDDEIIASDMTNKTETIISSIRLNHIHDKAGDFLDHLITFFKTIVVVIRFEIIKGG